MKKIKEKLKKIEVVPNGSEYSFIRLIQKIPRIAIDIIEEQHHEISELRSTNIRLFEEICELKCARDSMIECLQMAVLQKPAKKELILKSQEGEESIALLIPKEEVENILQRYSIES